jgi:cell division protein FtsQ
VNGSGGTDRDGDTSRYETVGGGVVPGGHAVLSDHAQPESGSDPAVGPVSSDPARARRGRGSVNRRLRRPLSPSRRRWRVAFFALALAGIAGLIAWALLGSRLFVVRSVVVTGTHLVPTSEVLAAADIPPGTPLIRVNTSKIAARVAAIRQVRSARVATSWPDRVVITVQERTPALAVPAAGGGFDLIDPDGVLVRWAASRPASLPLYLTPTPASSLTGDPGVSAAAAVLAALPARLRSSVASVTAPSPDQVTLKLAGGATVVWGGPGDAAVKARELAVLMKTHAGYYDLSSPATAVTK